MKKILFINQSAELYGSDQTFLLLLKNLDTSKFFPIVVLPNEGPLKMEIEKLQIQVIISPILKLYRDMFSFKNIIKFVKDFFSGYSTLKKLHKLHNFDIIYSNTFAVLIGAFFSKQKKIKHLWHVHEIIEHPNLIASFFPKMAYYFSDVIVCNSEATKQNIIDREKRNEKKCVVIYNGVNNLNATSISKKSDFGFDDNDLIITLVGRISRLKGHNLLLKTFKEKLHTNENIKLLFVGSPVPGQEFYLDTILNFINENKIEKRVKILPFTSKLEDIWKITDIAVMPSTEKESFGLVAAEAMLANKAVIGANHGGLNEIIINNKTGILVEPNNVNELSKAIMTLINKPELREQMGANGNKRILNDFSIESYIKSFELLMQDL
jgi:glycosyltransferase involved in cell wall biosynthesis